MRAFTIAFVALIAIAGVSAQSAGTSADATVSTGGVSATGSVGGAADVAGAQKTISDLLAQINSGLSSATTQLNSIADDAKATATNALNPLSAALSLLQASVLGSGSDLSAVVNNVIAFKLKLINLAIANAGSIVRTGLASIQAITSAVASLQTAVAGITDLSVLNTIISLLTPIANGLPGTLTTPLESAVSANNLSVSAAVQSIVNVINKLAQTIGGLQGSLTAPISIVSVNNCFTTKLNLIIIMSKQAAAILAVAPQILSTATTSLTGVSQLPFILALNALASAGANIASAIASITAGVSTSGSPGIST